MVMIFACGNSIRYAPSTPEMAPDAPIAGISLDGSDIICAKPATSPQKS